MFGFNNFQEYSPITQAAIQNQTAPNNVPNISGGGYSPILPNNSNLGGNNNLLNANNLQLGLGAVQTLGSLWSAFKQNKLAERSLSLQERAFNTNLNNQTASYNTALEDRIRSRYNTEGRSSAEADSYISRNKL